MRVLRLALPLLALGLLYAGALAGIVIDNAALVISCVILVFVVDEVAVLTTSVRESRLLQAVGTDAAWRRTYRQLLIAGYAVRVDASRVEVVVIFAAIAVLRLGVSVREVLFLLSERMRLRRLESRNLGLPGEELPPEPSALVGTPAESVQQNVDLLMLVGLVLAAASGSVTGLSVLAVAAVAGQLALGGALVPSVLRLRRMPSDDTRLAAAQAAFLALDPTVILYFSGGKSAVYQVNMWFETLERLDRPALVLLRERRYLVDLLETTVPILCMPFSADVLNFDFGKPRIALYVANVGRNLHLLRVPTLKSAFVGHGDSDKIASVNPFSKVYDEVWVAGEAGRERYERARVGVRSEHIRVVGRPQLDDVGEAAARPEGAAFTVLYAPTWEGWTDDPHASMIRAGREIVRALLATPGVRVIFKPHPLNGTVLPQAREVQADVTRMLAAAGGGHLAILAGELTLYQCFDESDAMISDISSVVSDYLRSEKPYLVTNMTDAPDAAFRTDNPSAGAAYLIDSRAERLPDALAAARGADPMRRHRHEVRRYLLGDPDVPAMTLFQQAVDDLYARARSELEGAGPAVDDDARQDPDTLSAVGVAGGDADIESGRND